MPNRMDRGFRMYQREFEEKALEVLRSGWYVLGREVSAFEEEFCAEQAQNNSVSRTVSITECIVLKLLIGLSDQL